MLSPVFMFPAPTTRDACCPLCHRSISSHRLRGRVFQCVRDVVIGADQMTAARQERLEQLQTRVLKVHPFGVDFDDELRILGGDKRG